MLRKNLRVVRKTTNICVEARIVALKLNRKLLNGNALLTVLSPATLICHLAKFLLLPKFLHF